jgi:hypothetical protein
LTTFILRGWLAWAHDFVSNPALTASFQALPGTNFIVSGAPIPRDWALTAIGAELLLARNCFVPPSPMANSPALRRLTLGLRRSNTGGERSQSNPQSRNV